MMTGIAMGSDQGHCWRRWPLPQAKDQAVAGSPTFRAQEPLRAVRVQHHFESDAESRVDLTDPDVVERQRIEHAAAVAIASVRLRYTKDRSADRRFRPA